MSNPYAPPPGDGPARPPVRQQPPAPGQTPPPVPPPGSQRPMDRRPPNPQRQPNQQRPATPDPEAVRRTSRHVMHFGLLMLSALLVGTLELPWQAASLLFAIAALVEGIRALRSAWISGLRGALVPMLVLGIGASSLLIIGTGGMLALWPVQMDHQTCLRGALTISAQDQCETDYQTSLDNLRNKILTSSH